MSSSFHSHCAQAVNPSTSFTIVTAEGEVDADDSGGFYHLCPRGPGSPRTLQALTWPPMCLVPCPADGDSEPEELDDSLLEEDFAEIMKADRDGRRYAVRLSRALP